MRLTFPDALLGITYDGYRSVSVAGTKPSQLVGNRAFGYEDIFCIFAGVRGADSWRRSGQLGLLAEHRR
jgi:hypothetical protein